MNQHIVLLKTLSDPTRLRLLKLVLQEELCVCELQEVLQISQPAVSQHIAKLKTAGLVRERRAGMWTFYRGDGERLRAGLGAFAGFLETDPVAIPEMAEEVGRKEALNRIELCCDVTALSGQRKGRLGNRDGTPGYLNGADGEGVDIP